MGEMVIAVAEFIASIVVEAAKKNFSKRIDEHKLREDIKQYVEKKHRLNELSTLAEEIDFQGLAEYVSNDLIDEVTIRTFSVRKKEREKAREEIIGRAVQHSHANTDSKKKRVASFISDCIDIIRNICKKDMSWDTYFLAEEIVDAVEDSTKEVVKESECRIINTIENGLKEIKSSVIDSCNLSLDNAVSLARSGNLRQVDQNINTFLRYLSVEHPLAPDYGYTMDNGRLVSVPTTDDAKKKYPPKFVFNGSVSINGLEKSDTPIDIANYAYRHQMTLEIKVTSAKKMLGDEEDPSQSEVEGLVGKTVYAKPEEFPPAVPCSIIVGNTTYYEYILFRTQEIMEDGRIVISNKEQSTCFQIKMAIDATEVDSVQKISSDAETKIGLSSINISLKDASNKEKLDYLLFMEALSHNKEITIHSLSTGKDLIRGIVNSFIDRSGITEEIDFIKRICEIEDYFDVVLNVGGKIYERDYNLVILLSKLVRGEQVSHNWDEAAYSLIVDNNFKKRIMESNQDYSVIVFKGMTKVDLLGAKMQIPYMRTYKEAVIKDLKRTKQLAALLDEGDTIKIVFAAGKDNTAVDMIIDPDDSFE